MRPFAAAGRPWHPSELARLGRNAVEDPALAGLPRAGGCRTLGASIGGGMGLRMRRARRTWRLPPSDRQRAEATGLAQELHRPALSALHGRTCVDALAPCSA